MSRSHDDTRPVYARVTDAIIADLQCGVRPWVKPWSVDHAAGAVTRPLRHNLEPYRGINVVLLWAEAAARGYAAPVWMTFRQALALGGCVRRGERGATVVYADRIQRLEPDGDGDEAVRSIPFLKAYTVFNREQIDGLADTLPPRDVTPAASERRLAHAEGFFAATGADIRHGGDQAFYAMAPDYVQTPPFGAFGEAEAYYATLAHECVHWTRHPSRLNRDLGRARWGDAGYAREELVAELGAAFLCADLGLELQPRDDHASYIASWLEVLQRDRKAIFTAASHAQRACEFLHSLQGVVPPD